jgi:hypothetical protein
MDVKYILRSILREAAELGAVGDLKAGVRLSGAVNNERGEGYLMQYEDGIVLLYRRLGQRDYEGCFAETANWSFDNYREDNYALALDVNCNGTVYSCTFTPSEKESCEIILNAIAAAHAEPQNMFSEATLLMAALIARLADDEHDSYARNLLGKALYLAGKKYAAKYEMQELVARSNELFTPEQKQSTLLNLIEMRMSDDLWTSAESSALRELAGAWDLGSAFFENAAGLLLLRRKIGILFAG